jgi:hypothetical protein
VLLKKYIMVWSVGYHTKELVTKQVSYSFVFTISASLWEKKEETNIWMSAGSY